jgi:hypothetical protein
MHILIFGGLSSVGVELIKLAVDSKRFSFIRVVSRSIPQLAFLSDNYRSYLDHVDFVHANTINAGTLPLLFDLCRGGCVVFCVARWSNV